MRAHRDHRQSDPRFSAAIDIDVGGTHSPVLSIVHMAPQDGVFGVAYHDETI